jgi:Activator of Hsp90 ATPase homolog 1-like protein
VWEPPTRVVLAWQISGDWAYDGDLHTEVEISFVSEAPDRTRVELEHRGLDAYGERASEMRDTFDGANAWRGILAEFAGGLAPAA